MIVKATLFWKLQTMKDLIKPLSKKYCFRRPFESQQVKGCQTLVKSAWEHFHYFFSSLWGNLACKKWSLSMSYILGVFRNTLTSNDKYPFGDCKNLSSPIQMQLYWKSKTFHYCFVLFSKSTSNFKHFEKNMIVIATLFWKLQTVRDFVRPFSKR